jgi:hypothetical protein
MRLVALFRVYEARHIYLITPHARPQMSIYSEF